MNNTNWIRMAIVVGAALLALESDFTIMSASQKEAIERDIKTLSHFFNVPVAQANVSVTAATRQKGLFEELCFEAFECKKNVDYICDADILYPVVSGFSDAKAQRTLNEKLFAFVATDLCEGAPRKTPPRTREENIGVNTSKTTANYAIDVDTPDLLAISQDASAHFIGAAHGRHAQASLIIDKKTGRELLPPDIFGQHIPEVNAYIYHQLQKDNALIFENIVEEEKEHFVNAQECSGCSLFVTPAGMKVTFAEYSIGPYVSGEIEVIIPSAYVAFEPLQQWLVHHPPASTTQFNAQ